MPEKLGQKRKSLELSSSREALEGKDISHLSTGVSESVDVLDDALDAMGNISEQASEGMSENGGSASSVSDDSKGGVKGNDTYSSQIAALMASKPDEKVLKKEIKAAINVEMIKLRKEAMQLLKSSKQGNAYKLNLVITRLRNMKSTLNGMMRMSYDKLKTLWLKVVHGIK